jgi:hypothetical protein
LAIANRIQPTTNNKARDLDRAIRLYTIKTLGSKSRYTKSGIRDNNNDPEPDRLAQRRPDIPDSNREKIITIANAAFNPKEHENVCDRKTRPKQKQNTTKQNRTIFLDKKATDLVNIM